MLTDDPSQQDPTEIRDLAKKLAMTFGIDLHRIRKPLVALHLSVPPLTQTEFQFNHFLKSVVEFF